MALLSQSLPVMPLWRPCLRRGIGVAAARHAARTPCPARLVACSMATRTGPTGTPGTDRHGRHGRSGWLQGRGLAVGAAAAVAASVAAVAAAGSGVAATLAQAALPDPASLPDDGQPDGEVVDMVNWSQTHEVKGARVSWPESERELAAMVASHHRLGRKLRAVGSAMSPNALAFAQEGMVNVRMLDGVLHVDAAKGQVTVGAGALISQVTEALRPHGLTLQNYASVAEQQVGGFTQVGAHGTGATVPPVDEQVVGMRLVTPALGALDLHANSNPELFHWARVGLGALGVVSQVTLQCVPAHRLTETTTVLTRAEVRDGHADRLRQHRHVRYMWIPYTDAVVVVTCDFETPLDAGKFGQGAATAERSPLRPSAPPSVAGREERVASPTAAMQQLLAGVGGARLDAQQVAQMNFAELRDELLRADPLSPAWIRRVNAAEAEFWRHSEGQRTDWSDRILGFECGGQQWVLEVAMPTGTLGEPSFADLAYMERLLATIEARDIPAPSPIEQRWTARSRSKLSPAFSESPDAVFSWVGIIMYLPTEDPAERAAITAAFRDYRQACIDAGLFRDFQATEHWAKLEAGSPESNVEVRERLKSKFPMAEFNRLRTTLDPNRILTNDWVATFFD